MDELCTSEEIEVVIDDELGGTELDELCTSEDVDDVPDDGLSEAEVDELCPAEEVVAIRDVELSVCVDNCDIDVWLVVEATETPCELEDMLGDTSGLGATSPVHVPKPPWQPLLERQWSRVVPLIKINSLTSWGWFSWRTYQKDHFEQQLPHGEFWQVKPSFAPCANPQRALLETFKVDEG